jgi:hypothetical protein
MFKYKTTGFVNLKITLREQKTVAGCQLQVVSDLYESCYAQRSLTMRY